VRNTIAEAVQMARDLADRPGRRVEVTIKRPGEQEVVVEATRPRVRRPAVDPRPKAQQVQTMGRKSLKRVRKLARKAARAAAKETHRPRGHRTQESAATASQRPAELTGAQLWERRADVLLDPAVASAGVAGTYWRRFAAGESVSVPIDTYTGGRGPVPYGGEQAWTAPADTATKA